MAVMMDELYFKGEDHRDLFESMVIKTGMVKFDVEYWSALYMLSAIGKGKMLEYLGKNKIAFDEIREDMGYMSSSEFALLDLAQDFFNGKGQNGFADNVDFLDEKNGKVVLTAVRMRLKI